MPCHGVRWNEFARFDTLARHKPLREPEHASKSSTSCQAQRNRSSYGGLQNIYSKKRISKPQPQPVLQPVGSPDAPRILPFQSQDAMRVLNVERFDNTADEYDEQMEEDELPSIFRMLELADIKEGETVLDLATGTGIVPDYVLNLVGPTGTVFGLDPSEKMLQKAQDKLSATPGIDNLAFIHSTVEDADFEPNTLDTVLCHNGMWYFTDPVRVVKQIKSWLKPGGRFVYNVFEVPCHPSIPVYHSVLAANGFSAKESTFPVGNDEALRKTFKDADFSRIDVDTQSDQLQYSSFKEYAEHAWEVCNTMTDFNRAEELLGRDYQRLQEQFYRRLQSCRKSIPGLSRLQPTLKQKCLWVKATV